MAFHQGSVGRYAGGGLAGEVIARYWLGLGDPPLSMSHPDIEYMFQPSQDRMRFGNRVQYNVYSMRSGDFPSRKEDPNELRVMVLGDSVINGGNLTDQSELATQIVADRLAAQLDRPVTVGNISAGSWGPDNQLAYVRLYGLFDSDIVVLVLSSHDANDVATFEPLVGVHSAFPDEPPYSALIEGMERYLPAYLPRFGGSNRNGPDDTTESPNDAMAFGSRPALEELFERINAAGAVPILIQHPSTDELDGNFKPGHAMIASCAAEYGVVTRQLRPRLASAVKAGLDPYRDGIHINPRGQQVLADEIVDAVTEVLQQDADGYLQNGPAQP